MYVRVAIAVDRVIRIADSALVVVGGLCETKMTTDWSNNARIVRRWAWEGGSI